MAFLDDEIGLPYFWQQIIAKISNYVPITRKVNNKALSADINLTASDVGALPSTTTALKNPNALTFTGAVTGSYDGSAAKSVAIPSVDSSLSSTSTNAIQNKAVNTALNGKASTAVATTSANGLMSSSDKLKLDGIADGANKTTVDGSLSSTSTNPVQNKVINTALSGKASTSVATTSANGLMSASDKTKLDGIDTGANKTTVDSALSTTSTNPVQNNVVNSALSGKLNTSGGTIAGDLNVTQSSVNVGYGGNLSVENDISSASVTTTDVSAVSVSSTTLKTTGATNLNAQVTKVAVLDDNGVVRYRTITDLFNDMVLTSSVWSVAYPVGSIYMSVNSTNPKTLFGGGTWVQIQGRFLLAASTTYKAGTTGGEATHTLTAQEMPNHQHPIWAPNAGGEANAAIGFPTAGSKNTYYAEASKTAGSGGGQAHNNMPPYLAVYVWKRTA